jgi:hypothetical protein
LTAGKLKVIFIIKVNRASLAVASLLALVLAYGAGCARHLPPMATAADAERGNIELAALQEGRTLLLRKCANCHQPPLPRDHTAAEWPGKIEEMAARSNIDLDQRRTIERYLVVMADAAAPAAPASARR